MGLLNPGRVALTLPDRICGVVVFFGFSTLTVLRFEVADRAMASSNYSCSESKRLAAKLLVREQGPTFLCNIH